MWRIGGLLWCLAGIAVAAEHGRSSVTPVAKVIELLKKLGAQVQEEGAREAKGYDKYACFCKEQSGDKAHVIEKSRLKIETFTAEIDALDADITQLDTDVVAAEKSIGEEKDEKKGTAETRDTAFAKYQTDREELTTGIEAITGAIASLKASRDKISSTTASALVQKALSFANSAVLKKHSKQEPAKYQHQSGDIIATLEDLNRTFKEQLARLDEEEAEESNQHNMVEGARSNRVKALEKEVFEKQSLSAKKGEEKADLEGLRTVEADAMQADQAFLDELTAACEAKAEAWDKRSKTRAGELTAITEAVGMLEGMGDLYETNKKLVGLSQSATTSSARGAAVRPHAVSLLQVALESPAHGPLRPVADLLSKKAASLKSTALASLAAKVSNSGPDHFVEVRALIKDLVSKLEAEAAEEATQKSFCDEEMGAALTKRDEQSGEIESNKASIDQTTSAISKLEEDINTVSKEIADLYKAKKELEDLRSEEKAINTKTISDADAGAEAVRNAITVLQNFYGSAGALVQKKSTQPNADRSGKTVGDMAPETFEGEYDGKKAESKGVLGLLEVIASDFERTSTTTTSSEEKQEADFKEQTETMQKEIDEKVEDKGKMEDDVEEKKTALIGFEDNLNDATKLHEDAIKTLETLKASCVESGESWEERRANRKKEIAALKEALTILENWKD